MGVSSSKVTRPHTSPTSICDKVTDLSTSVSTESLTAGYKKNNYCSRKFKINKKGDRENTIRINISNPSEFMHLNHAGIDHDSLDLFFIPVKQAQIIHMTTANMNYAADHSYHSTRRQMNDDVIKSSRISRSKLCKKFTNRHSNYDAIFSNELFSISRNSNRESESRIGVAY